MVDYSIIIFACVVVAIGLGLYFGGVFEETTPSKPPTITGSNTISLTTKPSSTNNPLSTTASPIKLPNGVYTIRGGYSNKLCSDDNTTTTDVKVICNRDTNGGWERFTITNISGDTYSIRGSNGNKYCADVNTKIICDRDAAGPWETFTIKKIPGEDKYSIQGGNGKKYCSDDQTNFMVCNRDILGGWEKFALNKI